MHYRLLYSLTGKAPWSKSDDEYDTPEKAAQMADARNARAKEAGTPLRWRVETVEEMSTRETWRARERARFEEGTYTKVPWVEERWFRSSSYTNLHFPHMSPKGGGLIAYTPDEKHGQEDRQVPIKVGRYLNRYFGGTTERPLLGPDVIAMWCAKSGASDEDNVIKFATKGPELEHVYINGPTSCMSHRRGSENRWAQMPYHPARAYEGGDLSIAYLERTEDAGYGTESTRITARAVCWGERKVYGRVYGDSYRFVALMAILGYRQETHGLVGARLKQHRFTYRGAKYLIVPYIDNMSDGHLDGDYVVLGAGPLHGLNNQNSCQRVPFCGVCHLEVQGEKFGVASDTREFLCATHLSTNRCVGCNHSFTDAKNQIYNKKRTEWRCKSCATHFYACISCASIIFTKEKSPAATLCIDCYPEYHMVACRRWMRKTEKCGCETCVPISPEEKARRARVRYEELPYISWDGKEVR